MLFVNKLGGANLEGFVGDISPDDMRRPEVGQAGAISGQYTKVVSKYRWPDKTVVWEFSPLLSNFSKIFILIKFYQYLWSCRKKAILGCQKST